MFAAFSLTYAVRTYLVHVYTVGIFRGAGERNRGHALLMTANKVETVLYRAPTFSLLLASHGGLSLCVRCGTLMPRLYIPWHRREKSRVCSADETANEPETALYRAPTFSLLLASHGGLSLCVRCGTLLTRLYIPWCRREKSRVCSADDG